MMVPVTLHKLLDMVLTLRELLSSGSGSADGNNVSIEEWGGWFVNMTEEELAEGPFQNH